MQENSPKILEYLCSKRVRKVRNKHRVKKDSYRQFLKFGGKKQKEIFKDDKFDVDYKGSKFEEAKRAKKKTLNNLNVHVSGRKKTS